MKISVCIPIYNYPALPLVEELAAQVAQLHSEIRGQHVEIELVCIDDGSDAEHRSLNQGVERQAKLVTLDTNVGRSRVRNLFLEHTDGDYLLFLDNDMVVTAGFLQRYVDTLVAQPPVVVGGIAYDSHADDGQHRLRYLYGSTVESRPAEVRRRRPYASFMTGNFMIQRQVLADIRFDESLRGYGHEDTLFGYELKRRGVYIMHIDNPAINGQVEDNAAFMDKTRAAVHNLAQLYLARKEDREFCRSVRLLNAYKWLKRSHVVGAVMAAWWLLRRPIEDHFEAGSNISVAQFNFYKLGLFCSSVTACDNA